MELLSGTRAALLRMKKQLAQSNLRWILEDHLESSLGNHTRLLGPTPFRASKTASARITGGGWCVVFISGRAEEFGEDGLQSIRPDLVALERQMQFVDRVHHAVEQLTVPIRQFVVDVHVPDS